MTECVTCGSRTSYYKLKLGFFSDIETCANCGANSECEGTGMRLATKITDLIIETFGSENSEPIEVDPQHTASR